MQDFGPSTCFCFLTVVAPMLTRENEGSKKSVRKVVQDFVHQQYVEAYRSCFGSNESHLLWVDVFFVSRPVFGSSKAFRNHQKPHFGAMVWDQTTINIFLNNKTPNHSRQFLTSPAHPRPGIRHAHPVISVLSRRTLEKCSHNQQRSSFGH